MEQNSVFIFKKSTIWSLYSFTDFAQGENFKIAFLLDSLHGSCAVPWSISGLSCRACGSIFWNQLGGSNKLHLIMQAYNCDFFFFFWPMLIWIAFVFPILWQCEELEHKGMLEMQFVIWEIELNLTKILETGKQNYNQHVIL